MAALSLIKIEKNGVTLTVGQRAYDVYYKGLGYRRIASDEIQKDPTDLSDWTVTELKAHSKELGLEGYSSLKKPELVKRIEAAQADGATATATTTTADADANAGIDSTTRNQPETPETDTPDVAANTVTTADAPNAATAANAAEAEADRTVRTTRKKS